MQLGAFAFLPASSGGLANPRYRLSEDPNISVLALEAGHSDTLQLFSRIPASFARLFGHASADYNFWTQGGETALGVKGRSLRWPRARMLGGCSAINGSYPHCLSLDCAQLKSLNLQR